MVCRQTGQPVLNSQIHSKHHRRWTVKHDCRAAIVLHDGGNVSDWRSLVAGFHIRGWWPNPPSGANSAAAVIPYEQRDNLIAISEFLIFIHDVNTRVCIQPGSLWTVELLCCGEEETVGVYRTANDGCALLW